MTVYRYTAALLFAIGVAICAVGFSKFESNLEDVFQWLPDDTDERQVYDDFVRQFGVDDFLVMSWPGCTIADARIDTLSDALFREDPRQLISQVISGRELIRRLRKDSGLSDHEIADRFRGVYFGGSENTTCILLQLTKAGMDERRAVIEQVKRVAQDSIGVGSDALFLAGHPQVGDYGDRAVRRTVQIFIFPSCILSTWIAWLCLRDFRFTVAILAIAGLAAGLSVAIVTLTGQKWGGLSSAIPALTYILCISGTMHLVNYATTEGDDSVLLRVLRIGWKPCLFSALTTAVGMLSLCASRFPSIRDFGFYCAAGVLVSLACQLLFVPFAIDWLRPHDRRPDRSGMPRILSVTLPAAGPVVIAFALVSITCGVGLIFLRSDLETERNFFLDSPVMKGVAWIEDKIGPVEQTELLVHFQNVDEVGFEERVEVIRRIALRLDESPHVTLAFSAASWIPTPPDDAKIRSVAKRTMFRRRLREMRSTFAESSHFRANATDETWRISTRVPFLENIDFDRLQHAISEIANDELTRSPPDHHYVVQQTGVALLLNTAQRALVEDLLRNYALAFAMICPLMILVLGSVKHGLLSIFPNVCPAAIAYGMLGWLDIPLDVGMAIAACVALGIAVDDTTHFLLRYKDFQTRDSRNNRTGPSALVATYQQCSRAMLHTSLITGFGLSPFLFGELATMGRFAGLLIALVLLALVCDLILLPALLRFARLDAAESERRMNPSAHGQ